ncbi:tetratricopeptide repeat protein [Methylophaga sp. UBA2689]|jgi:tetratricopeptide (TPR) repeat protein|uniref:tetratricopeptide repeat protein n=1 Tax=Methylophaga sp. UBA2689 TaxID=1946878 RepID=UPI0025DD2B4A|nr:tetratricopeptide repeat protein [Methylophaga sp. UBA2689]|tara:strand:- start:5098 stop:6321 length:1224 start_codon:yes stop_codon:yes gene_type:complete
MKKLTQKFALMTLVACLALPLTSMAEDEYLLSEATYKSLNAAQEKMEQQQYRQAEADLKKLVGETDPGSYERAVVLQTLGYLYSETEEYKLAAEQFEDALALNALPEDVTHNLRYNLAQLLISDGAYQKGIDLLTQWLNKESQANSSAYVLLATAYYQINQFTNAVEAIRTAIQRDNSPKENWYRLQLSAHMEMQQYNQAINVLEILIERFPINKTYWDQLAALYAQQDKRLTSLAVQMLAKRLNLGDKDTVLRLANMYRYLNIPYKSAQLLQKSMDDGVIERNFKNLESLADSWLAARENENATQVLARMQSMDSSGETDLKLARVFISMEQWDEAAGPLQQSLEKLPEAKRGQAWMLSGMVNYHLGNIQQSEQHLNRALAYTEVRNQASQWLRHLQNTRKDKEDA